MIKKGTKLRSKATGATCEVYAAEFDIFGMTYSVKVGTLNRHYTYETLIAEFDILPDETVGWMGVAECTCGGLKTYNSKEDLYHSYWCYYGKQT